MDLTTVYSLSLSPRFFKKASRILQSPPSVCPSLCLSVKLSPPKPLDEILPNLVCELLTWMGRATAHFFGPAPWEGPKGQISLNIIKFQLQSQFQRFFNQRYKTYQTGFSFGRLGHAPGIGLGGYRGGLGGGGGGGGVKKVFFRNSNRFGVEATHTDGTCTCVFFWVPTPWGLGEGPKGQISLNLNYKVNFKDFSTNLCISSHKWKIYNISDGYFIRPPGSCPGVGLGGTAGVGGS